MESRINLVEKSRLKIISFTPSSLFRILLDNEHIHLQQSESLPGDLKYERCFYDEKRDIFCFIVSSETFDEVNEGDIIPYCDDSLYYINLDYKKY